MKKTKQVNLTAKSLWEPTPTAQKNLDIILVFGAKLPVQYWRENFFFKGAPDSDLIDLTKGFFPYKLIPEKSHPVFALTKLPDHVGFHVCPCSSKKCFNRNIYRYLKKGCVLNHTSQIMDRDSRLVESVSFNIPSSFASRLRFIGEVPETCIVHNHAPVNS